MYSRQSVKRVSLGAGASIMGIGVLILSAGFASCGSPEPESVGPPEDAHAETVALVEEGKPAAVIVLPDEPHELEQRAAQEIATYIEKISGAKLEIIKTASAEGPAQASEQAESKLRILVGTAALAKGSSSEVGGLISETDIEKAKGDRPNIRPAIPSSSFTTKLPRR